MHNRAQVYPPEARFGIAGRSVKIEPRAPLPRHSGEHAPILAICGQAEATVRGASYQQELSLDRMFADVALLAQEASAPAQVKHLIDRCVRLARASNGPTVLILPKDVQDEDKEEPAVAHGITRSGVGYSAACGPRVKRSLRARRLCAAQWQTASGEAVNI